MWNVCFVTHNFKGQHKTFFHGPKNLIWCSSTSFNWGGSHWGVHFSEKVVKLWKSAFFSTLVGVSTKSSREQGVELKWPRGSAASFFDKDFHDRRKWGLRWAAGVSYTANLETSKYLVKATVTHKTRSRLSESQNNTKKDEKIRPVPGENTKYALCWHPQKRESPLKSSRKIDWQTWIQQHRLLKEKPQSNNRFELELREAQQQNGKDETQCLFLVSGKHVLTF